ncbi:MAG: ribonuclease P protein component [Clostridia bacterium]
MKRCYSLKRNKEFSYVYRSGKSAACRSLVIVYRKNRVGSVKIGLSVSKRIGKSVVRNRVKRQLRAVLTPLIPSIKTGFSIIFIARSPILTGRYADIEKSVKHLLEKASLL